MLNNLQVLRALAACLIVVHHARPFIKSIHPSVPWFNIGAVGVDLFFVISGFIMIYTSAERGRTPTEFWRERAVRILPTYWLVTLLLVALYVVGFRPVGLHGWDAKDLATSLLLLPNVRVDGVAEPIFTLGWTLIYEAFFYALFGGLLVLRSSRNIATVMTTIFCGLWLLGIILKPQAFAVRYYTSPLMLEFAAGAWLGVLFTQTRFFALRRADVLGTVAIATGVAAWIADDLFLREIAWGSQAKQVFFVGVPAVLIVAGALALETAGKIWTDRRVLLLGAASYSIYLWHQLALQPVYKMLARLLPPTPLATVTMSVVAFAAALALGVALHLALEKPVTNWFRRSRRQQRNAALPQPTPALQSI